MIIPLYKWGYWGTEKLMNISKVTQLGSDKAGIQSLVLKGLQSSVVRPASVHSISTLGLRSAFWSTQPSTFRNISKWAMSSSVGFPSRRLESWGRREPPCGETGHLKPWAPILHACTHWTSPAFCYFMPWMHQRISCLFYSLKILKIYIFNYCVT